MYSEKKSTKKKILSALLLAAVVVTTAVTSLTACGDDTDVGTPAVTNNEQQPPANGNGTGNGDEIVNGNGEREYVSAAPIFDWDGRDFRVLTHADDGGEWTCVDWTAEELLGEPINDAIVMRNLAIGDMFNINIVPINVGGAERATRVRTSVAAGDNSFEIAFNAPHTQSALAQEGMLWDLFEVPHLSLHEPWWDQNAVADMSISNRLYAVVGDIGTMYRMSVGILLFNKDMIRDFALDDPYRLVEEGRWTIDALARMLPVVSADLDGTGVWNDQQRFGMVGYQNIIQNGLIGAGIRFATKNADDIPEMTFLSERTVLAWEMFTDFLFDETLYWSWSRTGSNNERSRQMFANNQALFNWNEFHSIPRLRAMETDFGILPMPLFDEHQERFFHHVNPHVAPMFSIPLSNPNIEETGAISDHLAVLGRQIMTPAYYEISLQGQHARDEESIMTMDIIFSTLTFDPGFMNNWGDLAGFPMSMYHNRQSDLASQYERRATLAQRQLDRMIDNFLDR